MSFVFTNPSQIRLPSQDSVVVPARRGRPMPARLRNVIDENAFKDLIRNIDNLGGSLRHSERANQMVMEFEQIQELPGCFQFAEVRNSGWDVVKSHLLLPFKILTMSDDVGFVIPLERYVIINVPAVMAARTQYLGRPQMGGAQTVPAVAVLPSTTAPASAPPVVMAHATYADNSTPVVAQAASLS